jgi:hypothetical protein
VKRVIVGEIDLKMTTSALAPIALSIVPKGKGIWGGGLTGGAEQRLFEAAGFLVTRASRENCTHPPSFSAKEVTIVWSLHFPYNSPGGRGHFHGLKGELDVSLGKSPFFAIQLKGSEESSCMRM